MEIYVMRHTAVDVPSGICYGQTDVPLINGYTDEIQQIKKRVPKDIDLLISSPLRRCTFIAEEFNIYYTSDDRLLEMDFGAWEMQPWDKIPKQELDNWMTNIVSTSPPYGENLMTVQQRVNSFLDELRNKKHMKVLLVTHAGPMRCMWNYLLGTPLENTFKIPVGYGELLHFNLGATKKDDYIVEKM